VTGADLSNIDDSKADNPKQAFAGLAKSSNAYTYLDGDSGTNNAWAHSVVTTELSYISDGIVGHEDRFAYGQSLWVRPVVVYDDDGYMLIERHLDVADGYFSSEGANSGIENADDPYANTYSIIGSLDESKYLLNGQYYAFKLIYEYTPGRYDITEDVLEWTQTSWLTESSVTGADLSNIDDSKADNPKQAFAGLAKSSNAYTYLDGDSGTNNAWAHSVVTTELSYISDGIVGHEDRFAYGQSLWVRLDTAHYVAQGRTSWPRWSSSDPDSYCQQDASNQALYSSPHHGTNIGVGCCSEDGTTGYRPDCNAHPATYDDAVAVCSAAGYRLCTLDEMMSGITQFKGCMYDGIYQWVSDSCDISVNAAASKSHSVASEGNSSLIDSSESSILMIAVMVCIGVIAISVLVVLMMKKHKERKEESKAVEAIHVPDVSVAQEAVSEEPVAASHVHAVEVSMSTVSTTETTNGVKEETV